MNRVGKPGRQIKNKTLLFCFLLVASFGCSPSNSNNSGSPNINQSNICQSPTQPSAGAPAKPGEATRSDLNDKPIITIDPTSLRFLVVSSAALKQATEASSNLFQGGKLQTTGSLTRDQVFCSFVTAARVKEGETYLGHDIAPAHNTGFVYNAVSIGTAPKGDDVEFMSFVCGTTSNAPVTLTQINAALTGIVTITVADNTPGASKPAPVRKAECFSAIYKDKSNGLFWGKPLNGFYTNGCTKADDCGVVNMPDGSVQIEPKSSAAEQACEAQAGRLPTVDEFRSLLHDLGDSTWQGYQYASREGAKKLLEIFGDGMKQTLWTSTIPHAPSAQHRLAFPANYNNLRYASRFAGSDGRSAFVDDDETGGFRASSSISVICVSR